MPVEATVDRFHRAVLSALEIETGRIVEEEAERAATHVRQRVRALIGSIALSTLLEYDVERRGDTLVIRVRNAAAVDPPATAT